MQQQFAFKVAKLLNRTLTQTPVRLLRQEERDGGGGGGGGEERELREGERETERQADRYRERAGYTECM